MLQPNHLDLLMDIFQKSAKSTTKITKIYNFKEFEVDFLLQQQ